MKMFQRLKYSKPGTSKQNNEKPSTAATTSIKNNLVKKSDVTDKNTHKRNTDTNNKAKGITTAKPDLNARKEQPNKSKPENPSNCDNKAVVTKAPKNIVTNRKRKPFPLNGHAGCVLYILKVNMLQSTF